MNKRSKIYFRADASAEIGYGHFIRSLALADMLKDDFECTFFSSDPTEYQIREMEKVCSHVSLKRASALDDFLRYLTGEEIVVLDNYFYTTAYQQLIKQKGCKLVCIDDMHNKHYVADLIINQAINVSDKDYSCESYTRFAFGLKYSLLRKPFFDACKNHKAISHPAFLKVVVAFGGSDFLDLTSKVICGIVDMEIIESITAIVGDSYETAKMLDNPKVMYSKNLSAKQIVELFSSSDVAILPASTMLNEALACGTKIIGGYYVLNQENDYHAFTLADMIMGVGDYSDPEIIDRIRQRLLCIVAKESNVITPDTPKRMAELFKTL